MLEFDNVGNGTSSTSLNVSVPLSESEPYIPSLGPPIGLSTGGTLLPELSFDDRYKADHPLPFAFPFFGESFNAVTISTNGNLYFSTPPRRANGDADDVPSSRTELAKFKMISGLWDDLDLSPSVRSDAGVYEVQPGAGRIIFRWQGVPCNDLPDDGLFCTGGGPVNFEIELRSDGTIKTRYGNGNTDLKPVVGISGGSPDAYVIDSHTSEDVLKSLTNAQEVTFLPRAATPTPTPTPLPTPTTYVVSGRIVDANNNPVSSVRILFERNSEGTTTTSTTFTDAAGNFSSGNLGCQNNVKVTPSRTGFTFNPLSIAFTSTRCLSDTATANFTASGLGARYEPAGGPRLLCEPALPRLSGSRC